MPVLDGKSFKEFVNVLRPQVMCLEIRCGISNLKVDAD